jgi:hypothetical protein
MSRRLRPAFVRLRHMIEHFGEDVGRIADQLTDFYAGAEVVATARHHDPAELAADARRPGFRAVADISFDEVYGFAAGWTTTDGFEVAEVSVRFRDSDTGRELLTEITGAAPAWARAQAEAPDAIAIYRAAGWRATESGPETVLFRSPSPDDLVAALPMRDITAYSQGFRGVHCGGRAKATVDLDLAAGGRLEIVDATTPVEGQWWDAELVPFCLENLADGISTELAAQYATAGPALRVVVRDVFPHVVDANEWSNRQVGRRVVQEAVRRAVGP